MKFANLDWPASHRGMTHFKPATAAGVSESRFSRGLHGRVEFAPHERRRIAEILGSDEEWFFREPIPPRKSARVRPDISVEAFARQAPGACTEIDCFRAEGGK